MTRATLISTLATLLLASALLSGCGRDTTDAGAKLIGVGFDPGQIQPKPKPTGGLIDFVNLNYEATNLDLGATGLYYPGEPFVSGQDPFNLVLGFSYVFHPTLTTADELQLLSPKGPDMMDTCFVTKNRNGPLGSFTTVDLGEELRFVGSGMRFGFGRSPLDYPGNTADVFTYYIGSGVQISGHPDVDTNWAYDETLTLEWDGGVPPKDAPIASIPVPSWAEDSRTGKAAGSPTIYSPPKLDAITVASSEADTGGVPMTFTPTDQYIPSPFSGDGDVVNVRWEPWDEAADNRGYVVLQIRLQYEEQGGSMPSCPWDPTQSCECDDEGPVDLRCDAGYVPDESVGNNEGGGGGADNCDDGIDNDGDYYCDSAGCICQWDADNPTCPEWMDGNWMGPDPECARHYRVSECRDGACYSVGGDRSSDATAAELTCTVRDESGGFVIGKEYIDELMEQAGGGTLGGAFLMVSRTVEERVTMPMVRDEIGNPVDIDEVRVRVSNISVGRLAVDGAEQ